MARIAIVYHSGYGHTAALARAVERGAKSVAGSDVKLYTSEEATAHLDDLDAYDAIVFGTPTYMAGPSAQFKAFADATGKKWYVQTWKDKLAAGFTNSQGLSGDKLATLQYLAHLAAQHSMNWINLGVMAPADPKIRDSGEAPNRLSSWLGAMAQSNQNTPEPPAGDLKTGELLGQRVAEAAKRWMRGKA